MITNEIRKEIINLYNEKGINSVYAFLKRNNIDYTKNVIEFGLDSKKTNVKKTEWLNIEELKFHYYSQLIKAKSGWSYNLIRGIEISIN